MLKLIIGIVLGAVLSVTVIFQTAGSFMFEERESPFTVEETVARIQQNVEKAGNGWALFGLRYPARPVEATGVSILPVMAIEACSPKYSGPILKDDKTRFLSLLMPCKISVYKKSDGKVYIGTMNAGLIGKFFGPLVAETMEHVVADQKNFLEFDPSQPAPPLILPKATTGGGGGAAAGGC
ncbi:MAG: DUF302 domain-containing protein [Gammaproteobacteria bacterium]|nr:DUF302 domain-containing protein [Gammaproteobacteria bacterium]MBU1416118.1 DUF302 domain-containing protein [Gammaproteobacteria bacterium]